MTPNDEQRDESEILRRWLQLSQAAFSASTETDPASSSCSERCTTLSRPPGTHQSRTSIACPWELTTDWAYELLRRLFVRWDTLSEKYRYDTVHALMWGLDRFNNPRLRDAEPCGHTRKWTETEGPPVEM